MKLVHHGLCSAVLQGSANVVWIASVVHCDRDSKKISPYCNATAYLITGTSTRLCKMTHNVLNVSDDVTLLNSELCETSNRN